jgi:nickel-dependent lactate racemase
VLPVVLRLLNRGGIPPHATSVLIATGTHPKPAPQELAALVGSLPEGVHVEVHDCRDEQNLEFVGTLTTGLGVRLNRLVLKTDLLVTIGTVRHHYLAGFGGGPKMVFPGIAGYDEIQANHSRVVESITAGRYQRHPECEPGVLRGNPVAEEIFEAADLRPPDLAVCLVLGRDGKLAWAGSGPWREAFGSAVERVRMWYEVAAPEGSRLLITSAGGSPEDDTLIQAHKALDAACRFVSPGGEVLFVAEIGGGLGSDDMLPFITHPEPETILSRLAHEWVQYGHTTLRLIDKTGRYRVHLHSRLDPGLADRLGFRPVRDPADVINNWRERYPGETVVVVPGSAVYPCR